MPIRFWFLVATTLYQGLAVLWENRQPMPGQTLDVGGYKLHWYSVGTPQPGRPTIILDHSLGGVEGYLLVDYLAPLGRVCMYDRAGYGWSDRSPRPRTSSQIVDELDTLLTRAEIQPPYLLVGDSFGSYNMRLYAHRFPEKVVGLVLTDGLHEQGMLNMSGSLQLLQAVFIAGFLMSVLGSCVGIIRLLRFCRVFELLKPELKHFSRPSLAATQRSFCRPKHWLTMSQELSSLRMSGRQLRAADHLGTLPIVNIKASSFFKPAFWTKLIPLRRANLLREEMHHQLMLLSSNCTQIQADQSGHFVWVDQPDLIAEAVVQVLAQLEANQD